jgi:hypothetical protein
LGINWYTRPGVVMPGADATKVHGPSADRCTSPATGRDTGTDVVWMVVVRVVEEVELTELVVVEAAVSAVGAAVCATGSVAGWALPPLQAATSAAPATHDQGTMCRRMDVLRR